jgi:hypothetical protein
MIFSLEDKVKLKEGLYVGKKYGDVVFSKFMKFKGYKEIIQTRRNNYLLKGEGRTWCYSSEMLEVYKNE